MNRRMRVAAGVVSGAVLASVLAAPAVAAPEAAAKPRVVPGSLGAGGASSAGSNGAAGDDAPPTWGSFQDVPGSTRPVTAASPVARAVAGYVPGKSTVSARTETSDVFANPDGTKTTKLATSPINVETAPGRFEPIDTDLVAALPGDVPAAGKALGQLLKAGRKAARHPLAPVFSSDGTGGLLAVSRGSVSVRFTPDAAGLPVPAVLRGSQLVFPGAAEASDVSYEITPSAVKETIVARSRAAAGDGVWSFLVDAQGGTLSLDELGGISIADSSGAPVMEMPAPYITDSSGAAGVREPADVTGSYQLTRQGNRWRVSVVVPTAWLDDPARVWPVLVDPTTQPVIGYASGGARSYKTDMTVTNTSPLKIGSPVDAGKFWRSTVHWNYEPLMGPGVQVIDADVLLDVTGGTANSYSATLNPASALNYNGFGDPLLATFNLGTSAEISNAGFTAYMQTIFNNQSSGSWFFLRGQETPSVYTYKTLNPTLYLTTNTAPGAATLVTPADGATGQKIETDLTVSAATDPDADDPTLYQYTVSTDASFSSTNNSTKWTSDWTEQRTVTVPTGKLSGSTQYFWRVETRDNCHLTSNPCGAGHVMGTMSAVRSFTTNNPPPSPTQASALPEAGTVATRYPELSVTAVTDPDGATLKYGFQVATGKDARTGTVLFSGWLDSPSWQVPGGYLRDGQAYAWRAWSYDGTDRDQGTWANTLTVDMRNGDPRSSPVDTAGPVTVNLANGNAIVGAQSPAMTFAKNSASFGFTYNSRNATAERGLTGTYYKDGNGNGTYEPAVDGAQLMQRLDANLNVNWDDGSPRPDVIPIDNFLVRWTGYLSVPTTGSYTFGAVVDDKAVVTVNGTTVYDAKCCNNPKWGPTPITLTAGTAVPISVDYAEFTGGAQIGLWARSPDGTEAIVPAAWLSPSEPAALPAGWTLSTDLDGESPYLRAQLSEQSVSLIDDSGSPHIWMRDPTKPLTLTPPAGERGTLALTPANAGATAGQLTLADEDGSTSVFGPDGTLLSYTPADTSGKPAPLSYTWTGTRLTQITDTVSGLTGSLVYGTGTANTCYSGQSTPPGLSAVAPVGQLCRIIYPDQTVSTVWYSAATDGRLMQITDAGAENTQFGYDSNGLLSSIRDPLAYDAVAAGVATDSAESNTTIAYTMLPGGGSSGALTGLTVTAPAPTPGASRPARTYNLPLQSVVVGGGPQPPPNRTTTMTVAGTNPPSGYFRQVTVNDRLQAVTDIDAAGLTTTTSYRPDDLLEKSVDAAGRISTTVYDSAARPVAAYGPSSAVCFTGLVPANPQPAGCTSPVPQTLTSYDQGMQNLHVNWYSNVNLTGAPAAQSLGFDSAPTGEPLHPSWAAAAPLGGAAGKLGADNISARATGLLTLPYNGTYTFSLTSDDGARVWIDNTLVADQWSTGAYTNQPGPYVNTRGSNALVPIRLEYREDTGDANLNLTWAPPTSSGQPTSTQQAIPASALAPGYNLATGTVTPDSSTTAGAVPAQTTTSIEYGSKPWEGLVQSSTVDPGGLAVTTRTRYDDLQRRIVRALPGGNPDDPAARYTDTYYGKPASAPDTTCGVTGPDQSGRLATNTAPRSADGRQLVQQNVYDTAGRSIASRTRSLATDGTADPAADAAWTCTTYDPRGRTTQVTVPAWGGSVARTVTTNYTVGGSNPLVSSVTDPAGTITSTVDLLGRTVKTVDVYGTTTTTSYDQAGRSTGTSTTTYAPGPGAATGTWTEGFGYDSKNRPTTHAVNGETLATSTFDDTTGELVSVAYQNNTSLKTIGKDQSGRTTSLAWGFGATDTVTDTVSRSQAGSIITDQLQVPSQSTKTSNYRYDAAGRLTTAALPGHQMTYQFGGTPSGLTCPTGASPASSSGANTNRTGSTDTWTDPTAVAGTPATTTTVGACYDGADRLLTSAVTTTGPGTPSAVASGTVAYDTHGNTTAIGVGAAAQAMTYDGADRNTSLADAPTTAGGTGARVAYTRDATDRIIYRSATGTGSTINAGNQKYSFTGDGDTPDFVLNASTHTVTERTVSLPGGVVLTYRPAAASPNDRIWAYPNIHGDVTTTATSAGTRATQTRLYDPYGQPYDRTTYALGNDTTNDSVADTSAGQYDNGWLGQHQRGYEHAGNLAIIQMGARLYQPALGRFLSVDPEEGGSANDYDYAAANPVSSRDLDGKKIDMSSGISGGCDYGCVSIPTPSVKKKSSRWGSFRKRFRGLGTGLSFASTVLSFCYLPQCQAASKVLGYAAAASMAVGGQYARARHQVAATSFGGYVSKLGASSRLYKMKGRVPRLAWYRRSVVRGGSGHVAASVFCGWGPHC